MARDRDVAIHIKAIDEASKVISNVANNSIPQLAKRIAGIGAAYVSVQAGVDVLKRSVMSALEAEKATAGLTAALEAQKLSVSQYLPQLTAYAGSLSRLTMADDEAIQGAQKLLVSIGGLTGDGLDRATKAALNLSAGLGIDLSDAAEKIAKAASGSVRAFSQLGVEFEGATTDAEKFDRVLGFIEDRFGGTAQAQVKTMAGQVHQLAKAWGELEESFGKIVTTATPVAGLLETITGVLNVASEGIGSGKVRETLALLEAVIDGNPAALLEMFDRIERLKMDDVVAAALSGKFAKEADPVLEEQKRKFDAIIQAEEDAATAAKKYAETLKKLKSEAGDFLNFDAGPTKGGPQPIGGDNDKATLKRLVDADAALAAAHKTTLDLNDALFMLSQPVDSLAQAWERVDAVLQIISDAPPEIQKKLIDLANAGIEAGEKFESVGYAVQQVFEQQAAMAVTDLAGVMVDAAFGAEVAWDEALKSIIKGLIKAVAQAFVLKSVMALFGGGGGGAASGVVSIMSGGGIAGNTFANGGVVPTAYAAGGMFVPRGTDTVPAMLTPGEIVLPRNVSKDILGGRASVVPKGGGGSSTVVPIYLGGQHLTSLLIRNSGSVVEVMEYIKARRV